MSCIVSASSEACSLLACLDIAELRLQSLWMFPELWTAVEEETLDQVFGATASTQEPSNRV